MIHLLAVGAPDPVLIKLVVASIVGLVYLFSYLFGPKQSKLPPVAKRPVKKANPPAPGRAPQPAPQRPADSLSAEIEQFLKEAAQRKRDAGRGSIAKPTTPFQPTRAAVEPIPASAVLEPPTGEAVSAAVKRNLDNRSFAARADSLTDDIKRADQQREQHFKRAFDHKLGRLDDTSHSEADQAAADSENKPSLSAGSAGQLLAQPESLRQAVVLNEIFRRPDFDRW